MNKVMKRLVSLSVVMVALFSAHQLLAFPSAAVKTKAACASCHTNPAGGPDLSEAGTAWKADNTKVPEAGTANEYVGSKKCKMCHSKEHTSFLETSHAKAFTNLQAADPKKAAEMAAALKFELKDAPHKTDLCISCHVTGHRLAGGYPAADSTKNVALSMVGCESCHGPGGKHVSLKTEERKANPMINGKVTENMCKDCHTAEMSPKFKFDEYKVKGVHTVPAAK